MMCCISSQQIINGMCYREVKNVPGAPHTGCLILVLEWILWLQRTFKSTCWLVRTCMSETLLSLRKKPTS